MDTSRLTPIIRAFEDELGDVFVALLLVGSAATNYYLPGHSDVNLMLVIRRDATLQQVQKVVSAQWSIWENTLRTPPTVAYQSAFFRHLRLNPALNLHIQTYARLLSGQVPDPYPQPNQLKVLAAYCTAALTASAALSAPRSISPTTSPAYDQLHRLARRLTAYPLSEKATARQLFIIVQRELQSRLEQFRGLDKSPPTPTNNLEAIYSQLQQIVFVIPELSERQLAALDWSTIAASLDKPFQTIGVKIGRAHV